MATAPSPAYPACSECADEYRLGLELILPGRNGKYIRGDGTSAPRRAV